MEAGKAAVEAESNKDAVLRFRVSSDEKKRIEDHAKAAGYKKTSDYLRTVALGTEVKEVVPAALRRNLVGIGTNLNQIARRIQSSTLYATDERHLQEALAIIRGYLA